jgi:serine/threonine protein kinase
VRSCAIAGELAPGSDTVFSAAWKSRAMTEPQSPDLLPVGTILDGTYRLTRLLGQGAMGTVYEGHHTGAGKRVAVKVMHRELLAYPELAMRFRREAKVTSELTHPHIVSVFGFGTTPAGQPYLVMELLDGEDLQTRLERVGALPLETVVQIVNQVASALAETHAAGVVHRDLKTDNVFLVRAPDDAVLAKVVDFGLSKVLKTSATKLTVARAVFGTPEFMAPEQAEGRQDAIDHRSDQWSLACLAWFASTACLPFTGPDVNAILNQVISAVPTPVSPGAPRMSAEVEQVLRRALSRHRADRFPTIRAFARAFEAAASGVSPEAAPAHRAPPPPAGLAVEAARRPPQEAREVGEQRGRRRGGARVRTWLAIIAALAILGGAGWLLRDRPPISTWVQQARTVLDRR